MPWSHGEGVDVELYPFFNVDAERDGVSTPRPGRFTPGKRPANPLYRRLGGTQDRSVRVPKILPVPGFESEPSTLWLVAVSTELSQPIS